MDFCYNRGTDGGDDDDEDVGLTVSKGDVEREMVENEDPGGTI